MAVFDSGKIWWVNQGRWYKLDTDQDGYKIRGVHKVHRLVLLAFIGPPPSKGHVARHLNGNPGDNSLKNLVWGTQRENWDDRRLHGSDLVGRTHSNDTKMKMSKARFLYWQRKRANCENNQAIRI